ncbi:MAG TPA: PKD domain-containing protein [Myxococcales bacterium]|nr:PKD domain-containing protein [Myxococcales bacterium]
MNSRISFAAALAALSVVACSSSSPAGSSNANAACQGEVPVAVSGPALTAKIGTQVQLSGSSQQAHGTVSYSWRLLAVPQHSTSALAGPTTAAPTFTADAEGVFIASLAVSDDCGTSADATTTVTVSNHAPQASAVARAQVSPGDTVTLNGSGTDADGEAVAFRWSLLSAPAGSAAVLSSTSAQSPTFVADRAGTYVAMLVVTDGIDFSDPVEVVVQAVAAAGGNHAPVAVAGAAQQVLPGATVTLNGSASDDADHDPLTYQWSFLSKPATSIATLVGATTVSPHFVPDVFGTWIAVLTVNDGQTFSAPSEVIIQAGVTDPAGTCPPVAAPIASAGNDQTVSGQFFGVSLNGTASKSFRSSPLTFQWTLASAPAGSTAQINGTTVSQPSFFPDLIGTFTVSLVVNDGCANSAPAIIHVIRTNAPPQVSLFGFFQPAPVLVPLQMQASVFDQDNQTLTYRWQVTAAPSGSVGTFSSATAPAPTFTPDLPGTYTFSLVVSDGVASSAPATISATVINPTPVASAGVDQAASAGATVTLDGSASTDPSLRALTYHWTLTAPAGSTATLSAVNVVKPTFVADVTGSYKAQVTVSAGGNTSPVALSSVAVWPAVNRLAHRVVDAAYSVSLDRLIMVAADPSALYIYDPRTATEVTVPLSLAPSSVGLSGDGHFAAVGHTNAISYVDLQAHSVASVLAVTADIGRVTLGDNGFVYAIPRVGSSDRVHLLTVPLTGGATEPVVSSALVGPVSARLRRTNGTLYLTNLSNNSFFGSLEEYTISNSLISLTAPASALSFNPCGDMWLSQDSNRLLSRCGQVVRASSLPTDDLAAIGTLAHSANFSLSLHHSDDSTTIGEISAIASQDAQPIFFPTPDDRTVRRWSTNGLTAKESLLLPSATIGAASFNWSGRFVFYRSDGSERYIVLQLDPAAGATQDFGVVTF